MDLDKVSLMTEIDSLRHGWQACEAERDALALQNLRLREAIRNALDECVDLISTDEERRLEAAVSLPLPDAAREVEAMREKAGLLDEIIAHRISVSYRGGVPATAHVWSARTDDGFGTGNTLPEALAALRAAKGGGQ